MKLTKNLVHLSVGALDGCFDGALDDGCNDALDGST